MEEFQSENLNNLPCPENNDNESENQEDLTFESYYSHYYKHFKG